MNKGQERVLIEEIGAQGDGVGYIGEKAVYAPMTMPGDEILVEIIKEQKSSYATNLLRIEKNSAQRVDPLCQHFGKCGGCQLQMLPNDQYKKWIKKRITSALDHHELSTECVSEPLISPLHSRRRVALKVLKTGKSLKLGFNRQGSAQLVDLQECPVTEKTITALFSPLKELLNGVLKNRDSGNVHITLAHSGLDLLIDVPHELTLTDREALSDFAHKYDVAAIHWMDRDFMDPVLIRREPVMLFGDKLSELPPAAFIQATQAGEKSLIDEMAKAVRGHKRMADLFSGIGTFSLPLASEMQVLAVEGSKAATDALQNAVNSATGLKKILVRHRDLYRRPLTFKELEAFDAVVFDPPRAGAREQVIELAQSNVQTIVGVSCNPNTFGRDARLLVDGGYTLEKVVPVDQFLFSPHLEVVGIFRRHQ
ncbi:23S rRNA (uracil(1939)-C(5))-methyltransferase RlmD [Temperatibacter marinus]|uniref:23S rRNA (Uracil(1939)-C(5))-methyltransferase RlmD n=1 Tax=Temperatibacter marinus TaxID=1456591 RepID=A0AA52EF45_9PROT|nr:23S rRNA (uracil(1939)-C(5))-methyltransferase RlmD [Temperatibacter marinus]WND01938.1 23S rRNA (uracil(1939)-C(5))-methyltransferase RlmD [Temperatibacter marinus]